MIKNWRTTLTGLGMGLLTASAAIQNAIQTGQFNGLHGVALAISVGMVILGALSKDAANKN